MAPRARWVDGLDHRAWLADQLALQLRFGRRFVEQRSSLPVEGAPDGLMIIAPAAGGDGFTQHYFDSRGVVRLYAMTFDGREPHQWTSDPEDGAELLWILVPSAWSGTT